jgi:hypothetical protein
MARRPAAQQTPPGLTRTGVICRHGPRAGGRTEDDGAGRPMLNGERVVLAPLREVDLAAFYEAHVDIRTRGGIVPGNMASRRIAEKCGFTYEGLVRGAFFNDGRNHDVALFGLLRDDPRPWHDA